MIKKEEENQENMIKMKERLEIKNIIKGIWKQ